jgi:uncharacterized protein
VITRENLAAFLEGLAILGTGGGGSPSWGRAILEHDFDLGRAPCFVDPTEVPDHALVASGGIMGSVQVLDRIAPTEWVRRWDEHFELIEAFRVMEETLGRRIDYVVPCEMGGLNTPVVISLCARTGRKVIDGDGLGRASPETNMVSFVGYGVSLTPMPLVDVDGNVVVVRHGVRNTYADTLGRWVIANGGGMGANAHYPMSGAQLKKCVVPNTISGALALGNTLLQARERGLDIVQCVASALSGQHIHTGIVENLRPSEAQGFYLTSVRISGDFDLIIKNETMALFAEGRLVTIFPDLVCLLDPLTGRGLMSDELRVGQELAVIVAPCHSRLRRALESEAGQNAFSPARFGRPDLKNQPLAELLDLEAMRGSAPPASGGRSDGSNL